MRYKIERRSPRHIGEISWALDFPVQEQDFPSEDGVVNFKGWVVHTSGAEVFFVVQVAGQTRSYPLNVARPDVVEHVAKTKALAHAREACGFSRQAVAADVIELGFECDGLIGWVATLTRA